MDPILSDLATRCSALLRAAPGAEGRRQVAALLSELLSDPAKGDLLVPPSTGQRDLLFRTPSLVSVSLRMSMTARKHPRHAVTARHGPSMPQARGETEMTDFELLSEASDSVPGTVDATAPTACSRVTRMSIARAIFMRRGATDQQPAAHRRHRHDQGETASL